MTFTVICLITLAYIAGHEIGKREKDDEFNGYGYSEPSKPTEKRHRMGKVER